MLQLNDGWSFTVKHRPMLASDVRAHHLELLRKEAEGKTPSVTDVTHGLSAEAAGGPTTWHWAGLISSLPEGLVSHVRVRCQTGYPYLPKPASHQVKRLTAGANGIRLPCRNLKIRKRPAVPCLAALDFSLTSQTRRNPGKNGKFQRFLLS
jgi:hypothetical protein